MKGIRTKHIITVEKKYYNGHDNGLHEIFSAPLDAENMEEAIKVFKTFKPDDKMIESIELSIIQLFYDDEDDTWNFDENVIIDERKL